MTDTCQELRRTAAEIRAEGHAGWGNTCEQAADDFNALSMRLAKAEQALREICAVDKAAPERKDCWIWADMLEIAVGYFPNRDWRNTGTSVVATEAGGHDSRCSLFKTGLCDCERSINRASVSVPAFDPDTFHDYVIAHGYGAPTELGYEAGKVLMEHGDDYAVAAFEVVARGLTVPEKDVDE